MEISKIGAETSAKTLYIAIDCVFGGFSENKVWILNVEITGGYLRGIQAADMARCRLRRKASLTSLSEIVSGESARKRAGRNREKLLNVNCASLRESGIFKAKTDTTI